MPVGAFSLQRKSPQLTAVLLKSARSRIVFTPVLPILHQTIARASPEPPRSTSDPNQRCYGEAPVGLRRCERAVGNAAPPIPPKTAKNPKLPRKSSNRKWLRDLCRVHAGPPPWSLRGTSGQERCRRGRRELERSALNARETSQRHPHKPFKLRSLRDPRGGTAGL
jgi:hypothetical protein